MPEARRPVVLSADLRAVLAARGVKTSEAARRRMAFRTLERAQWSLPRGTLKKSVDEETGIGYVHKPLQQPHPPIAVPGMSPN